MAQQLDRSWSSQSGFLLATIGVSVGLGNLWRFPFIAGENGGGAFVIVYLLIMLVIAVPLVAAELVLGKRGKGSAVHSMGMLVRESGAHRAWKSIGYLSMVVPFLGILYYAVVAGWSFHFIYASAIGAFTDIDAEASTEAFKVFTSSPLRMIALTFTFLFLTALVVGQGLQKGIEKTAKFMMPALFAILVFLVIYAAIFADFARGVDFLFNPDFSKLTGKVVLMALGQAFFSVAIGVGALITFSGYLEEDISIPKSAAIICFADTAVAILAGLAIFPFVFSAGLEPASGPGLIFETLPTAFGDMTGGAIIGSLFFVLLFFAAFTSALGMLEPVVSWVEERFPGGRRRLTFIVAGLAFVLSIGPALAQNVWSEFYPLSFFPPMAEYNMFRVLDFLVANLIIPINGMLIALFAGWVMKTSAVRETLGLNDLWFKIWQILIRYLAPIAIGFALYSTFVV